MSENLPARVSSFRQALESAGTPKLGSMGAPDTEDRDTPTIPTATGREMIRRRFVLEEEQKETVKLIHSTSKRCAELYIDANTELREATGRVIRESDKLTSERHKAICEDFEEFTTEDLGVDVVENMRWGKAQVQKSATRFHVSTDTPKPQEREAPKPQEMVLRKRTSGGLIKSLLGRGTEIWEVDR